MKKCAFVLLGTVLAIASLVGCTGGTSEVGTGTTSTTSGTTENTTTTTTPSTVDEQVKAVLDLTNSFRTGNEAFYLNRDNTTTTSLVGQLGTLTLDNDLCKAAEIRSKELLSNFSHTRPDGKSCFSVLSDLSISYSGVAENIAAGNKSGEKTFLQWKEDNENYDGQGHRRNMLGDFTKIGIAYVYDANSTYKYYWTMILTK